MNSLLPRLRRLLAALFVAGLVLFAAANFLFAKQFNLLAFAAFTGLLGAVTGGVFLVLRKRSATLPIIVASGMGHEKFVSDLRELGVPTFLKKPFAAEDLLKSLHAELHREDAAAVA
jgi:hypothetical protein